MVAIMNKNKMLEGTADFIDNNLFGRMLFYSALLSAPALTGYTAYDIIVPDLDTTVTAQSTADKASYLKQLKQAEAIYSKAEQINEVIPNIQTPENLVAMQQHQQELYELAQNDFSSLELEVLTDNDLTEMDYLTISKQYNSSSANDYMKNRMSGVLDECRISTANDVNNMTQQASAIKNYMDEEGLGNLPVAFFVLGLPLIGYLGLAAKGIQNDVVRENIPDQVADFLRNKTGPKSH